MALLICYDNLLPRAGLVDLNLEIKPTLFDRSDDEYLHLHDEESIQCCWHCCYTDGFKSFSGFVLIFLVVYNMSKVPFYTFDLPATNTTSGNPTYGMESSPSLAWMGVRGAKIKSDPVLFLLPHTLLGSFLLSIATAVVWGKTSIKAASRFFFPLSALFALHVIPVADGLPSVAVNVLGVVGVLSGAFLGTVANKEDDEWLLHRSFGAVLFFLVVAAVAELLGDNNP